MVTIIYYIALLSKLDKHPLRSHSFYTQYAPLYFTTGFQDWRNLLALNDEKNKKIQSGTFKLILTFGQILSM